MRLLLAIALVLLVCGCSRKPPPSPDTVLLERSVVAMKYLTSPTYVERVGYTTRNGTPSELVSLIVSEVDSGVFPRGDPESEVERALAQSVRKTLMYGKVPLIYSLPDPRRGPQVVVYGDDSKGEIVAVGYLDPAKGPVSVARWPMPDLKAR
ncbi:hypothetical protein BWI17_07750 [Betaproteobacteria bacterium GR16-43]|nr:hypothetical protein BWI17_07750 [Betaproteobacteria bacterium GR16-43]